VTTNQLALFILVTVKVHSIGTLLFYMVALFALGLFYEYWRLQPARLEYQLRLRENYKNSARSAGIGDASRAPLLSDREGARTPLVFNVGGKFTPGQRALRSLLHTSNVAISFFLMLVVMTYNTYLVGSVLAGAFVGHFMFHDQPVVELDRGMACH